MCSHPSGDTSDALAGSEHATGKSQVAGLERDAEPIAITAVLPNKGEIELAQREQPNQFSLVGGKGQQLGALFGGQQFAARHGLLRIKARQFSQVVLEMLFSNRYPNNEFRAGQIGAGHSVEPHLWRST